MTMFTLQECFMIVTLFWALVILIGIVSHALWTVIKETLADYRKARKTHGR